MAEIKSLEVIIQLSLNRGQVIFAHFTKECYSKRVHCKNAKKLCNIRTKYQEYDDTIHALFVDILHLPQRHYQISPARRGSFSLVY